jgi:hypothetical protein
VIQQSKQEEEQTVSQTALDLSIPKFQKTSNLTEKCYFQQCTTYQINDYLRYVGPISNKKFHGFGKILTKKDDLVYEGEFYKGKYDGRGKMFNILAKTNPQEFNIKAEIVSNYMSLASANYLKDLFGNKGLLSVNFSDDNWEKYEGNFRDGKKHGIGVLWLRDGRVYEGEFVNGLAHGYGILKYFEKQIAGRWNQNMLEQFL